MARDLLALSYPTGELFTALFRRSSDDLAITWLAVMAGEAMDAMIDA